MTSELQVTNFLISTQSRFPNSSSIVSSSLLFRFWLFYLLKLMFVVRFFLFKIFHFCFAFLKYITGDEFNIGHR